MALEINDGGETVASIICDRRLFLTADKQRVVEAADPDAAFLLAGEGSEIPMPEAERLGLEVKGGKVVLEKVEEPMPEPEPEPEPEEEPKPKRKRRSKKTRS